MNMKKYILFLLSIFIGSKAYTQNLKDDLILDIYSDQPEIKALKSITLKNGFYIPTGKNVTLSIAAFPQLISQPSTDRNYILSRTFRTTGVTSATLNNSRSIGEENQSIQYIDGIGRPSQIVRLMASPKYKDIVQHIEYDVTGKESLKYLPYADQIAGNGTFKLTAKSDQQGFYKEGVAWDAAVVRTPTPYSVTVYDNSILNRVKEQGAPGSAWQPANNLISGSGHTVRNVYESNVATGTEAVKYWRIDYNSSGVQIGATSAKKYAAGKLFKTIVRDENWVSGKAGTTEEFKDFESRIVLKRVWNDKNIALDTYYIYDDFGNLSYVVPPAVTVTTFTESLATFTNFVYAYHYDDRRRLIEKKVPGKGWEWLVYNDNDKVVLKQDALQRSKKQAVYTKYDRFGRVVESGLFTNDNLTDRLSMQNLVDSYKSNNVLYYWEERNSALQYTDRSFPGASGRKPLVTNYYDDYSFEGNATTGLGSTGITKSDQIKGLLTGSKVTQDDGTAPLISIYYYDNDGRLIRSASQNQLSGTDVVTNTYLFSGELKTSERVHRIAGNSNATTILTTNEYDHVGRLIETKKKINTLAEVSQSQLSYNEIGQLKQKNLHNSGTTAVQEVVYGYNERGWTKTINDPVNVTAKRLFGVQLTYGDKAETFNGNIGSMIWNTRSATLQPVQTYTYSYDKLNRLTKGVYKNAAATSPQNKLNYFNEELAYDNMGNIDTLRRKNGTDASWYNNFKYTYAGNQLTKITDIGTAKRGKAFNYDVNGNANKLDSLKISNIEYNYLNLPRKFVKGTDSLVYRYDGFGQKLTKTFGSSITQYIDGIQYKNGAIEFIQTEEGRILPNGSSYIYEYFLQDHLGNTRAIVDHNGAVKQIQDYYPFGMDMNQGNALSSTYNLYKYNGKEKQLELSLDQLDYGARFYDAEIGRWNVVDPLADEFEHLSPYNYGMNNPILMIDPTGMAADSVAGSIMGPIINVWGKVTATFAGALTKPTTLEFPKFRPTPPPNPFVLAAALFLLPADYFGPKRNTDEMEWYRERARIVKNFEEKLNEILKDAKKTRTTGTGVDEYEKEGGMDQANKDYDDLVAEGTSKQIPIGRVGKTIDGKTINVRSKSSPRHEAPGVPGPPSVEIYNPNTGLSEIKIRYPKK